MIQFLFGWDEHANALRLSTEGERPVRATGFFRWHLLYSMQLSLCPLPMTLPHARIALTLPWRCQPRTVRYRSRISSSRTGLLALVEGSMLARARGVGRP